MKNTFYNECMMTLLAYAYETGKLTKYIANRLSNPQRAMERAMLVKTLRDRKKMNFKDQNKIKDKVEKIKARKLELDGIEEKITDGVKGRLVGAQ